MTSCVHCKRTAVCLLVSSGRVEQMKPVRHPDRRSFVVCSVALTLRGTAVLHTLGRHLLTVASVSGIPWKQNRGGPGSGQFHLFS